MRTWVLLRLDIRGGGVAERDFDLRDPDNVPLSRALTYDGLTSFLSYAEENGLKPIIVIPTKIWLHEGIAEGDKILTKFIKELTNGKYGDASNAVIEIGNEYQSEFRSSVYQTKKKDGLTGDEYGEIASKFVKTIETAASHDLEIAVQIGKTAKDNADILAHFNTKLEKDAIDLLVFHDYFWTEDAIEGRFEKRAGFIDEWKEAGIDAGIFISEWNVGWDKNNPEGHDYGLTQASAMVEFISEAAKAGVDMATVWALQNHNGTALTRAEGDMKKLSFAGRMFEIMAKHLIGAKVLNIPDDKPMGGAATLHAFESATEVIIFLTADDFDDINNFLEFNVDLSGFGSGFSDITALEIWSNLKPDNPKGWVRSKEYVPELTETENGESVNIEIHRDHGVVVLVLTKEEPGVGPSYDNGSVEDDVFLGTEFDDTFFGANGDDIIEGGSGDDELSGGNGNDVITDNLGNNKIFGGSGNDYIVTLSGSNEISGGKGRDIIVGGIQSDKIFGGKGQDIIQGDVGTGMFGGSDTIRGGKGDDIMMGGSGADIFVFGVGDGSDLIASFNLDGESGLTDSNYRQDFDVGIDQIKLHNFTTVNSSNVLDFVTDTKDGAVFFAEGTSILLYGVDASELSSDEFIF